MGSPHVRKSFYCVAVLQIDDYVNFISKANRQRFVLTTNDLFQKDRTTSGKQSYNPDMQNKTIEIK
jgi:hypothetical protein